MLGVYCMNILTLYSENDIEDATLILQGDKNTLEFLLYDPQRLYNDANHFDVTMNALTIKTSSTREEIEKLVNQNGSTVFVYNEDPNDWK